VLDNRKSHHVVSFERDQRPLSVVVVVDTSARAGSNMEQMQLALRKFRRSPGSLEEPAPIRFSGQPQLVNDFACDFAPLRTKLVSGLVAVDTPQNDALWLALQVVRGGRNLRKTLVVITGGIDNQSRHAPALMNPVRDSEVRVYGGCPTFPAFQHEAAWKRPAAKSWRRFRRCEFRNTQLKAAAEK